MAYTADTKQLAIETRALHSLYNEFGRGKIEEWNFMFTYARGGLGRFIKANYSEEEIAERLYRLGLLEVE